MKSARTIAWCSLASCAILLAWDVVWELLRPGDLFFVALMAVTLVLALVNVRTLHRTAQPWWRDRKYRPPDVPW